MPKHKKSIEIESTNYCCYGCGQLAKFLTPGGKEICQSSPNKCPAQRLKNVNGAKLAYTEGKRISGKERYALLPEDTKTKMAWSKGLTKETDSRVLVSSTRQKGKRKITDQEKLNKVLYREQCQFNLAGIIERIEGFELLKQFGMYNRHSNTCGVVRDHIISVHYGYKNNIDPKIISHPANCRFILHLDNAKKSLKSDITLDELLRRIGEWDREGNTGIPC